MTRYFRHYSNKKGRTNRMISMQQALPDFLQKKDTTGGLALVRLWNAWDELMGEMASIARPLGHRGTKLILAAQDPMVMQEAQFLAPMILDTVNDFFQQDFFDKVIFELLNGRVPLDGAIRPEAPEPPRKLKKPTVLGKLDAVDPHTAFGRCYQAYQKMFEQ